MKTQLAPGQKSPIAFSDIRFVADNVRVQYADEYFRRLLTFALYRRTKRKAGPDGTQALLSRLRFSGA